MPAEDTDYLYRLFRKLGLSDLGADVARGLIQGPLAIVLILAVALVVSRTGARLARRSVQRLVARSTLKEAPERAGARAETLGGVAASLVRVAVWTVAVLLVIDKLGVNAGPVVAGASIVGVALGFGAQSLVKDFVSGFFILAEDQFGVGDSVTVNDITGSVEEVNLRVTRIRGIDGSVWYVPNGEIRKVGNSNKEWARAIVDVVIPSAADLRAATAAMAEELARLPGDPAWGPLVLEEPQVLGVESMATDAYTVRVMVKTLPADRARLAREIRSRIGARLRTDGVLPLRAADAHGDAASPDDAGDGSVSG